MSSNKYSKSLNKSFNPEKEQSTAINIILKKDIYKEKFNYLKGMFNSDIDIFPTNFLLNLVRPTEINLNLNQSPNHHSYKIKLKLNNKAMKNNKKKQKQKKNKTEENFDPNNISKKEIVSGLALFLEKKSYELGNAFNKYNRNKNNSQDFLKDYHLFSDLAKKRKQEEVDEKNDNDSEEIGNIVNNRDFLLRRKENEFYIYYLYNNNKIYSEKNSYKYIKKISDYIEKIRFCKDAKIKITETEKNSEENENKIYDSDEENIIKENCKISEIKIMNEKGLNTEIQKDKKIIEKLKKTINKLNKKEDSGKNLSVSLNSKLNYIFNNNVNQLINNKFKMDVIPKNNKNNSKTAVKSYFSKEKNISGSTEVSFPKLDMSSKNHKIIIKNKIMNKYQLKQNIQKIKNINDNFLIKESNDISPNYNKINYYKNNSSERSIKIVDEKNDKKDTNMLLNSNKKTPENKRNSINNLKRSFENNNKLKKYINFNTLDSTMNPKGKVNNSNIFREYIFNNTDKNEKDYNNKIISLQKKNYDKDKKCIDSLSDLSNILCGSTNYKDFNNIYMNNRYNGNDLISMKKLIKKIKNKTNKEGLYNRVQYFWNDSKHWNKLKQLKEINNRVNSLDKQYIKKITSYQALIS